MPILKIKLVQLASSFLLIFTVSFNVMADWVAIGENGDGAIVYADPMTIRKYDNFASIWVLWDFKNPVLLSGAKFSSMRMSNEYDCRGELQHILIISTHSEKMALGDVLLRDESVHDWVSVIPKTSGQTIFKLACGIE
jgi:hypothetical protein